MDLSACALLRISATDQRQASLIKSEMTDLPVQMAKSLDDDLVQRAMVSILD
jgi:hypothetical protein